MVTKKRRIESTDEPLPEDYYDSFAGRGQDEQDQWDLEKGLLPSETVQPEPNYRVQYRAFRLRVIAIR